MWVQRVYEGSPTHTDPLRMYSIGERWMAVSTIGPTPVISASEVVVWPPDVAAVLPLTGGAVVVVRGVADVLRS